ncbi:MAG: ElyC/SanA/YdcF family protein [Pseudomonadota bacterium]
MPGPSLSAAAAPFVRAVADAPAADAIVVLGARIHADGRPYSLLVDRLVTAEDLWRHGKAPRIVLSGRGGGGVGDDEVAAMRRNCAREVAARVWAWCEVAVAGR